MTSAGLRTIDAGGRPLEFHLRRSGRRTLAISVEPERRVLVTAPIDATEERIARALRRRASWIRRQQRAFEALPPPPSPRQWIAGETHRYLGRQYRLKLARGSTTSAGLSGGYFVVTLPDTSDRASIQRLMERWYRWHAEKLLQERVVRMIKSTTWLELEPPPITVRVMKNRWGSTTRRGRVYFNIDVVKLPLGCVDYVIVHELAHLKIPHHGPAFWGVLTRSMPDWRRWRERLLKVEV